MRRLSNSVIILVVYAIIVIVINFVLPTFIRVNSFYGGYIPFFLFFPFMFRRGFGSRRKSSSDTSENKQPEDELLNGNYNTSNWEAKNRTEYDEFGIPVKKVPERTWYYIGIAVVFAVSISILLYRGIFSF